MRHIPVLLKEVIDYLNIKRGGKYIDATYGMGGHSKEILKRGGEVLGIDKDSSVIPNVSSVIPHLMRDPELDSRLRGNDKESGNDKERDSNDIVVVNGSFADIGEIAKENGFENVDGILFDLGFGSHQLDDANRGFSFQKSGSLDMRYDTKSQVITAAEIVNSYQEKDLVRIFKLYGEEKNLAKKVAKLICNARTEKKFETTDELFELIKTAVPRKFAHKTSDVARRIFQALRIEVNTEFDEIKKALPQATELLAPGGRILVISFHSLEDRIVKSFIREKAKDCICPPGMPVCRCDKKVELKILTKKPVVPSEKEQEENPRSKSAKLRVGERL